MLLCVFVAKDPDEWNDGDMAYLHIGDMDDPMASWVLSSKHIEGSSPII